MFTISLLIGNITESDYKDLCELLTDLYGSLPTFPSATEIEKAIKAFPMTVARDAKDGKIVGMATLVTYRRFALMTAHAEDVCVIKAYRRQGIGKMLMEELQKQAVDAGARAMDLETDLPRIEAISMYEGLGYTRREKVVFRKLV